jgi:hypothetical protein
MLLDQDPWLLSLKDCRGTTPLGYVKYDSHCVLWKEYLEEVADKYWPCVNSSDSNDLKEASEPQPESPPLALLKPNSRPIPDPKLLASSLEELERVANGIQSEDADHLQEKKSGGIKRITFDSATSCRNQ